MAKPLAVPSRFFDIKAPLISSAVLLTNPVQVTASSLPQHKKAVSQIAKYFQREFDYDFAQYEMNESDLNHKAYLWVDPECIKLSGSFRVPCIGATCFRQRKRPDLSDYWAMQWIWLHPYFRRKGLLKNAWPGFKKEFPGFECERPLSGAMEQFLSKMKIQEARL